jgi:hypothetical protein
MGEFLKDGLFIRMNAGKRGKKFLRWDDNEEIHVFSCI